MRRPALRGAARESGPLCGGPVAAPRGSTTSQVAAWSGVRGSLSRSQSAMLVIPGHRSIRGVAAQDGATVAGRVLHEETVQVEFGAANGDEAGQLEVGGGLTE